MFGTEFLALERNNLKQLVGAVGHPEVLHQIWRRLTAASVGIGVDYPQQIACCGVFSAEMFHSEIVWVSLTIVCRAVRG